MPKARLAVLALVLGVAGAAAPAAAGDPPPEIDWSDFVDEAPDPDLVVGEEMC